MKKKKKMMMMMMMMIMDDDGWRGLSGDASSWESTPHTRRQAFCGGRGVWGSGDKVEGRTKSDMVCGWMVQSYDNLCSLPCPQSRSNSAPSIPNTVTLASIHLSFNESDTLFTHII